jgi:hypothetical protein
MIGTHGTTGDAPGADPLAAIAAYWQDLRGTRQAPRRSEIDPRAIADALACALLIEQGAADDDGTQPVPRIRLAGRHICALMGMELRGMPVHALIATPDRPRFAAAIARVFAAGAALDLALCTPPGESPRLTARMILLPLADDQGGLTRAISSSATRNLRLVKPVPAIARRSSRWDRRRCDSGPTGPHPSPPACRRCIRSRPCRSSRNARRPGPCLRRGGWRKNSCTSRRIASKAASCSRWPT